uniref:Uncharacterized protein n=1 Tax=Millerozyma acaciae TaxID=28986 RepID=Q707V4_9ASCO|nr:hypothetical protein [Millerozyma acaciae]
MKNDNKRIALYGYNNLEINEDNDYLVLRNGYRNFKVITKYIDNLDNYYSEANSILIANNIFIEPYFYQYCYYDFHYPSYETVKKIKKLSINVDISFVCVINKWNDLIDDLSNIAYSYCLYSNNLNYIKEEKKEIEGHSCVTDMNDTYFFKYLNTCTTFDYNYEIVNDESLTEGEYISKYRKYNTYQIVNNYDIAECCFKNGEISNLVLSKLICTNPNKYNYLLDKYNVFLLYTRDFIDINSEYIITSKNNEYLYLNKLYINILTDVVDSSIYDYNYARDDLRNYPNFDIDIPEYTIYKLAIKYRNKKLINKIMDLYHKNNNKFIKILDIENERYVYEEINEIPKVDNFNPLMGDELNPYFNNI